MIDRGPQLLDREDRDVADEMLNVLLGEGINVVLGATIVKVEGRSGTDVRLHLHTDSANQVIEGTDILVAAGRVPNTAGIGLEEAGVEWDERGYVRVDARLQTSAPGVWAIGEAAGSPQFTHVSVDDFRIVRDNLAGGDRSTKDRLVPYTVFSDPPLAHVGLRERDALSQGIPVRVAKLPMKEVLRTQATDEFKGFMKVIVSGKDDRLLGFSMVGAEAGEVLAAMQTAILSGMPYQGLRDAVITHLTFAEGFGPLLSRVPPLSPAA